MKTLLLPSLFLTLLAAAPALTPVGLRCGSATDPAGVDVATPPLSWQLEAAPDESDKSQTAWQILAASSPAKLAAGTGDLWDSGKVESAETLGVPYAGTPLASSQAVWWQVRSWDEAGRPTAWSAPATWTMGLLEPAAWLDARWIGGAPGPKSQGYHGLESASQDTPQWVQVDLGSSKKLSAIEMVPMVHAGRDGFGFPLRFKIEASDDAAFTTPSLIADHSAADHPNPGAAPVTFNTSASGRYVRVTATKLWQRDERTWVFALDELAAISGGANIAGDAPVSARDSVEQWGWGAAGLTDQSRLAGSSASRSPGLRLRREFTVKPGLHRALLHVCGLGQYELSVNGRPASDDWLSPGWTAYNKTCLYDTIDLTSKLRAGSANALGVDLVGGMYRVTGGRYTKFTGSYGPLQMIAVLRLEYDDGSVDSVTSDGKWQCTPGPNTFSCIFGGLDFDARLDVPGWNMPGHDSPAWHAPAIHPGPGGVLRGQSSAAPPLRLIETLPVAKLTVLRADSAIYDFGQNAPLAPRLTVSGPAGSKVRLTPAELLGANGEVDRGSCGGGNAWWEYTCKGGQQESWTPKFWYHGARYLQSTLIPADGESTLPAIRSLEAAVVHSSSTPTGKFTCSNDLFKRVRTLVRWAQRANLVSVISDCPHRERLGWLEQYHLHGPSLRYEWDMAGLYAKTLQDMTDSQTADGLVPDIAPEYTVFNGGFRDSPEWGASAILVPIQQYEWTGDPSLIRRHYPTMKRYLDYLGTKADGHILSHGLGDWYDIGPGRPGEAQLTPKALTATALYFMCAESVAKSAELLGNTPDATACNALAGQIKSAFNARFFNGETGSYSTGSQTANALPLVAGLVPQDRRADVVRALVADLEGRDYAVTAGDIGHRYLLRALADAGRSDLIARMHSQTDRPGYGYILDQGATALTEAWDAGRGSSHNHFMLGHITEWFYHDLAGIRPDPAAPGFKHFFLAPQPVANVDSADATYQSARGPVRSAWVKSGETFTLKVEIPPNTTATVILPDGSTRKAGSGTRSWTIPPARRNPAAPDQ